MGKARTFLLESPGFESGYGKILSTLNTIYHHGVHRKKIILLVMESLFRNIFIT